MDISLLTHGIGIMPDQKMEPTGWATVRVRVAFAAKLADISEAWGEKKWPKWRVLEHLLRVELPDALSEAQPRLREIRKAKAKTAALQGGPDDQDV